jgi:phage terminase Nu1 subunit (DNA packaging protein)
MDEDDVSNVEAHRISYYRKKANKRAADEDVEDVEELYSQQNREIPISKKKNEKVFIECKKL